METSNKRQREREREIEREREERERVCRRNNKHNNITEWIGKNTVQAGRQMSLYVISGCGTEDEYAHVLALTLYNLHPCERSH